MNVVVLSNMVPFVWGGAEELAQTLVQKLRADGVNAEAIRIPFSWEPPERLIEEVLLSRSLRLANVDRVIALKFPTYHVPHDNKVLWVVHQYRQAYDLWDAGQSNIPDTDRGREIREFIRKSDNETFASARSIYTISDVTAARLLKYNQVSASLLRTPLNDAELFTGGEFGDYVFAGGRVNGAKRQALLVRAMSHLPESARLVVAGPPDGQKDAEELRRLVGTLGLEGRVVLDLRLLDRQEIAALVNGAAGVATLPFDEDSLGYVAMEAAQAGKPVITTTDSGGLLQLVRDGQTGYVVEPDPDALAPAIADVLSNKSRARRLGDQARARWLEFDINWPTTLSRLLS